MGCDTCEAVDPAEHHALRWRSCLGSAALAANAAESECRWSCEAAAMIWSSLLAGATKRFICVGSLELARWSRWRHSGGRSSRRNCCFQVVLRNEAQIPEDEMQLLGQQRGYEAGVWLSYL